MNHQLRQLIKKDGERVLQARYLIGEPGVRLDHICNYTYGYQQNGYEPKWTEWQDIETVKEIEEE